MTTRALVKDHPWSTEKARAGTIGLAVAAETTVDGVTLRAMPEHLVKGDRRAVRILVSDSSEGWEFRVEIEGQVAPRR